MINFNKKNILIIGDVMIDRYVMGKVSRISPEAPVPVLEWKKTENRLGGAANVALNIKALEAKPLLMGVVGDDEDADVFCQLLKNENIDDDLILKVKNRPTTVKSRMMAAGQQLLRLDQETTDEIDENIEDIFFKKLIQIIDNQTIDCIIFQDYNKGFLTKNLIEKVLFLAKKNKILTTVDPKKANFTAFQNVNLFKPNLKEISTFLGENILPDIENLKSAAAKLHQLMPFQNIMITLSEKGIFVSNNDFSKILPTSPRNISDVCGAGDTVIAVASLALSTGMDLEKIAILCNIAGGQVCEEIGVVPIDKIRFFKELKDVS